MESCKGILKKNGCSFRKNDQEKFNRLYHMYERYVYKISLKYLQDRYLAEDSTQNTFVTIMKSLEVFEELESDTTKKYISVVAKNQCCNMYHKEKRYDIACVSIENDENIEYAVAKDNTEEILHQEAYKELMVQIKKLPPIYSELLILKYVYQLSCKEIGDKLHVSYPTVRKRMERARQKLAYCMQQEEREVEFVYSKHA